MTFIRIYQLAHRVRFSLLWGEMYDVLYANSSHGIPTNFRPDVCISTSCWIPNHLSRGVPFTS